VNEKVESEKRSGNVFRDLDLPDADELLLKAELGYEIFRILEERGLNQTQAAKVLGVKRPEISRLKGGKFNHYSVERLLTFLNRLSCEVRIHIRPEREGAERVIALRCCAK